MTLDYVVCSQSIYCPHTYVHMHNLFVCMYVCMYIAIIHNRRYSTNSAFTTYIHRFCIVIIVCLPSSPSAGLVIAEMTTMVVMSMTGVLMAVI